MARAITSHLLVLVALLLLLPTFVLG